MTLATSSLHAGTAPSLGAILRPEVNLLILSRTIDPDAGRALERVAAGASFECPARIDVARPDPSALLEHVSDRLARDYLAEDLTALVGELGAALGRRHVHARLSVVRHDACRKLHTDNVTIRMLCTYTGPGTEWVPDAEVVRENLARADVDVATANRSVLRRLGVIRRCAPGDVILLKGDAFEGNRGRGAVHRSPPVEARGLTRLVLKVDEHPCGC